MARRRDVDRACERAEIPVSVEMSGTILVEFDGTEPDWSPKFVWIERENGLRHCVGCRPFPTKYLRDEGALGDRMYASGGPIPRLALTR